MKQINPAIYYLKMRTHIRVVVSKLFCSNEKRYPLKNASDSPEFVRDFGNNNLKKRRNELVFDINGKIIVDDLDQKIKNPVDPFKLNQISNINLIFELLDKNKEGYTLNEKLQFLSRLEELSLFARPQLHKHSEFQKLLSNLKTDLQNSLKQIIPFTNHNFNDQKMNNDELNKWVELEINRVNQKQNLPKIGTLSQILKKIECFDPQVWFLMENHLIHFKFLNEFSEIEKSMEGFATFPELLSKHTSLKIQKAEREFRCFQSETTFIKPLNLFIPGVKNLPLNSSNLIQFQETVSDLPNDNIRLRRIFKILEREMLVSMDETVSCKTVRRISDFLFMTKSPNESTYQALDYFAKVSIAQPMHIELDDVFQIHCNFAMADKGSVELFECLEHMLIGERTQRVFQRLISNYYDNPEKVTRYLISLEHVLTNFPNYQLTAETKMKLKESLCSPLNKWNMTQLEDCYKKLYCLQLPNNETMEIEQFLISVAAKTCPNQQFFAKFLEQIHVIFEETQFANIKRIFENSKKLNSI